MSDTPEQQGTVDVSAMSEPELRAHYAQLSTALDTLESEPRTIESARAIRALRLERNQVATLVNEIMSLVTDDVEDTPLGEVDAAPTVAEALDAEPEVETPEPVAAPEPVATDTTVEPEVTDAPTAPTATVNDIAPVVEDTAPAAAATNTETAPTVTDTADTPVAPVAEAAETATSDDVTNTPSMEETPVAENHDQNIPTTAETQALVAEAEAIVADAPVAVTAGLHDGRPVGGVDTIERPKVGYLAQGGQNEFSMGTPLDMSDLGRVIRSVQESGRAVPDGQTISGIVASLPTFEATEGLGDQHEVLTTRISAVESTALIGETVDAWYRNRKAKASGQTVDAITAAICTPLDIIREIPECGVTATPFADQFPQRGVGRLGFQYFPAMALADTDANVNVWTESNQNSVDEATASTWKPSPLIACLPATSVTAEELVASARVDNSTQISQPEQVVQFMHKLAVQRARRREQYLLGKFDATASAYTATGDYGALAALLSVGLELMPRLVYRERLDEGDYNLVLEPGHFNKLLADENSRVFGDTTAQRRAGIISAIKDNMGVGDVIVLRDFRLGSTYAALRTPGSSAVALPRLYDANRVRFVPAGAYIFGATGEESTGWETDPQLTRQNRMQWFSKEWLLLAKHGCHPAATVDLTSCASGSRANGVTPVDCTSQTS